MPVEVLWIVLMIIFAITESVARARKRAEQDALNRERRMRQAGGQGQVQTPQQYQGRPARPQIPARPVRRTPVTWREPGQAWPSNEEPARAPGMAQRTAPALTETVGTVPADQYSGSLGYESAEGMSAEWDIPEDHPDWSLAGEDTTLGPVHGVSHAGPTADAVQMLSGASDGGVAHGAATAIVLSEVLGEPRAFRPWRRRTGAAKR